jgi:hypothetical protein
MTRQTFLLYLVLLSSCTRSSKSIAEALPKQVGQWTLTNTRVLPAEEAPALVRSLGLKGAIAARYAGTPELQVRVYEMNVEAGAFELIQKWRQNDEMALYKGPYFIVADSRGQSKATVMDFLQTLQRELQVP